MILMVELTSLFDNIADYREGTFTLRETNIMNIFILGLFGIIELLTYIFGVSFSRFDYQRGISIFSGVSRLNATWDEVQSILFTLNPDEQKISYRPGGILLMFAKPYLYHSRLVTMEVNLISGKKKKIQVHVKVNTINQLFRLLVQLGKFSSFRTTVDISKNKKRELMREQWQFTQSSPNSLRIYPNTMIRDGSRDIWQKKLSRSAKVFKLLGWISVFGLCILMMVLGLHIDYLEYRLIWIIIFGTIVLPVIFGFILALITPELRNNSSIV